MTLQEQFNQAREKFEEKIGITPSFITTEIMHGIKTEIKINDIIISVGFSEFSYSEKGKNEIYLYSMLNALGNYDLSLISK